MENIIVRVCLLYIFNMKQIQYGYVHILSAKVSLILTGHINVMLMSTERAPNIQRISWFDKI